MKQGVGTSVGSVCSEDAACGRGVQCFDSFRRSGTGFGRGFRNAVFSARKVSEYWEAFKRKFEVESTFPLKGCLPTVMYRSTLLTCSKLNLHTDLISVL